MTESELTLILNAVVLPVVCRALLDWAVLRGRPRTSLLLLALLAWCDLTLVLWLECSTFGVIWFAAAFAVTILALPASLREFSVLL
jgi:hypothetical protein